MYLKSLEVQGFKSFANKITFDFHNGITGIVGPNGSGKSNVADAVRWVLGEQSAKQLRGGNMQDVIFSGTENRKPLGYAYVAITLDNSDHKLPIDYEEVTVSRRVYRSGESEYLMNGSACRLKDINELFYDTGIGKEGYSIIGQGQIDKILSGKPEERRELFDEAAGIVKYKRRKKTAEKKLESQNQNLVRISDIQGELEKQLEPLLKQSETAKIYLKRKEELRVLDANLFLLENKRIKEQLAELIQKKDNTTNQFGEAEESHEKTRTEFEELQSVIDKLDIQIEEYRSAAEDYRSSIQQTEGRIDVLHEQNNTSRLNEEHYQSRIKTIDSDVEDKSARKSTLKEEKQKIDETLNEISCQVKTAEEGLLELNKMLSGISDDIEESQASLIELLNQRASIKGRAQRYDTMLEQIQVRNAELSQKVLLQKSEEAQAEETLKKHKQELKDVQAAILEFDSRSKSLEQEIKKIQEELTEKNKQLEIGQTTYHREESRLYSLKNIIERYDGYGNSIRKVMEQKKHEPGILGVVADIVKVKKRYETAIETALGGSIQNIVTSDELTAKRMIDFLKKNKYGRATFLPLTSVKSSQSLKKDEVLSEDGVMGIASELVETDSRFTQVAGYLLGRTLVVENIDKALVIARKYKFTLRIVTLEGESLSPGGSMSGGAYKNAGNLLGRRREMEDLQSSVKLLKEDLLTMQKDIDSLRDQRTDRRRQLADITEELHGQHILQNTVNMNIKQVNTHLCELREGNSSLHGERQELGCQIQDIGQSKAAIEQELEESEAGGKVLEERIRLLNVRQEETKRQEESNKSASEKIRIEFLSLQQKRDFVRQNSARLQDEIDKLWEEKEEILKNAAAISGEIEQRTQEIDKLTAAIKDVQSLREKARGNMETLQKRKDECSKSYKSCFTRQEELSKQINLLDKELLRLQNQIDKLEEAKETFINYMWEEYELTLNQAKDLYNEEYTSIPKLKKQISDEKDGIKKLGDVNVNAIEDYKELFERHSFLKAQHDDLIEAEQTLLKIIKELEEGMRKQFNEKFAEIQQEFDKVFKQLFGGGRGTLSLVEDEDVLEAGIKIISQPPGKKLQNMMQLSGGEKALTAIALLFAIQNLKPSPFCLLDEIEAALDDSNVTRYAKYLHRLTKHTQFIIITHRKGTMAAADRLYGITMQEKGVSALVSVNLIEEELDK